MMTAPRPLILAVLLVATMVGGCKKSDSGKPATAPAVATYPPDKVWTAEEVAKDPDGYMRWADAKVGRQLEDRKTRLRSIGEKLAQIESRQKAMSDNLRETENIRSRMATALRRAEDEDRFPVQMAGRKYERAEAIAILEQTKKYIDDRKPLTAAYETAVSRLRGMTDALNGEIGELNRLREKMAIDLEAVRLTQSIDDLNKLRKSEQEITGFASAVGAMAADSISENLPEVKGGDVRPVDIDSFLNGK